MLFSLGTLCPSSLSEGQQAHGEDLTFDLALDSFAWRASTSTSAACGDAPAERKRSRLTTLDATRRLHVPLASLCFGLPVCAPPPPVLRQVAAPGALRCFGVMLILSVFPALLRIWARSRCWSPPTARPSTASSWSPGWICELRAAGLPRRTVTKRWDMSEDAARKTRD